jgi:hypothetical protein
MYCEHSKRIGDNYGITCQNCGQQLEGYGYGGFFGSNLKGNERCVHVWYKISDVEEECMYCHSSNSRRSLKPSKHRDIPSIFS